MHEDARGEEMMNKPTEEEVERRMMECHVDEIEYAIATLLDNLPSAFSLTILGRLSGVILKERIKDENRDGVYGALIAAISMNMKG